MVDINRPNWYPLISKLLELHNNIKNIFIELFSKIIIQQTLERKVNDFAKYDANNMVFLCLLLVRKFNVK